MDEQGLVVAVRLCDAGETEQPDPLCLRPEEMASWENFETLLRDMYQEPPEAIKVSYLDDESDWVAVGSDDELKEAIRLMQVSGEILQLQVKRKEPVLIQLDTSIISTQSSSGDRSQTFVMYVPTTDPGGDVYDQLVYPHSEATSQSSAVHKSTVQTLVYPHPKKDTYIDEEQKEQTKISKTTCQSSSTSSGVLTSSWKEAEKLSTVDKMEFLKRQTKAINKDNSNTSSSPKKLSGVAPDNSCTLTRVDNRKGTGVPPPTPPRDGPFISEAPPVPPRSVGSSTKIKQNFWCEDPSAIDIYQDVEPEVIFSSDDSPTLTPIPAGNKSQNKINGGEYPHQILNKSEETSAVSVRSQLFNFMSQATAAMSSTFSTPAATTTSTSPSTPVTAAAEKAVYTSAIPKCKVVKRVGEGRAPQPLPRQLQMMEGAQSGANAVAIEMPSESDFSHATAANEEERIDASGGASSTPASEETGEVVTRAGGDAAAVTSRETKTSNQALEVPIYSVREKIVKERVKKSSKKKEKTQDSTKKDKNASAGIKIVKSKKTQEGEPKEGTKKSSSEREEKKKAKVTEDVESGEKVSVKTEAPLQLHDFVKHMKKVKKDIHSSIVKDVTKQTDKLIRKACLRSMSQSNSEHMLTGHGTFAVSPVEHPGIYCDDCEQSIVGIRYKCGNCKDFDLCEKCEAKVGVHDDTHVFLKLRRPARHAGCSGSEHIPLLREKIYSSEQEWLDMNTRLDSILADQDEAAEEVRSGNVILMEQNVKGETSVEPALFPPEILPRTQKENDVQERNSRGNVLTQHHHVTGDFDICPSLEKSSKNSFDLEMASGIDSEIYRHEFHVEEKPEIIQVSSKPVPTRPRRSNDCQDGFQSQTSDSSSSITPVTPPPRTIPMVRLMPATRVDTTVQILEMMLPSLPCTTRNFQDGIELSTVQESSHQARNFEEEEEDDDADSIPELIPKVLAIKKQWVSQSEDADVEENDADDDDGDSDSSFQEVWDSDTSDDFCIIDPPPCEQYASRVGYELIPDNIVKDGESEVKVQNPNPQLNTDDDAHGNTMDQEANAVVYPIDVVAANNIPWTSATATEVTLEDNDEKMMDLAETAAETDPHLSRQSSQHAEEKPEQDENLPQEDEKKTCEDENNDLEDEEEEGANTEMVHKMNKEERNRFEQLLRKEMDKEYEEELKKRAKDLEKELQLQKEKELHIILEAKEREAVFENERLEWVARQEVDANARFSHQASLASMSSQSETLTLASQEFVPAACSVVDKRDADCQTIPESVHPASHLIQNVASGVSKAASTAYYTAKDVFHTLQAKQNEWKATPSTYKPPQSNWQPLADNYKPPVSTWTPPPDTWTPPKDDYVPPKSGWVPKNSTFIPPNIELISITEPKKRGAAEKKRGSTPGNDGQNEGCENKWRSSNSSQMSSSSSSSSFSSLTSQAQVLSQPTPITSLEIGDSALRKELQNMQRLIEMGFANREKNRQLMNKFEGDLEKVVQSLLQEEGETEDEHWSFHRH